VKKKSQSTSVDQPSIARTESTPNLPAKTVQSGDLPESIEDRLSLVFRREQISPQKRRLLRYIAEHPDAWTHEIAGACAVSYPPNRLGELNADVLWRYGLWLHCHAPAQWLINRFGDRSNVHQWRLRKRPSVKQEAA